LPTPRKQSKANTIIPRDSKKPRLELAKIMEKEKSRLKKKKMKKRKTGRK